jgi:hypothetical protein
MNCKKKKDFIYINSYESTGLLIQSIIFIYFVDWHRHLLNRLWSDSRRYLVPFQDNQEAHNKSIEVKYCQIQLLYLSE